MEDDFVIKTPTTPPWRCPQLSDLLVIFFSSRVLRPISDTPKARIHLAGLLAFLS